MCSAEAAADGKNGGEAYSASTPSSAAPVRRPAPARGILHPPQASTKKRAPPQRSGGFPPLPPSISDPTSIEAIPFLHTFRPTLPPLLPPRTQARRKSLHSSVQVECRTVQNECRMSAEQCRTVQVGADVCRRGAGGTPCVIVLGLRSTHTESNGHEPTNPQAQGGQARYRQGAGPSMGWGDRRNEGRGGVVGRGGV